MNTFIKLVIATIMGDDATAKAIRIQKRASTVLGIEIASIESAILQKEDNVEQAKEALLQATINQGSTNFSESSYTQRIICAKNRLVEQSKQLEELREKLEFFKERKAFVEGDEAKDKAKK